MNTQSPLQDLLQALIHEGGNGNQLVVSGGTGWMVLRARSGEPYLSCELATAAHLPTDSAPTEDQLNRLTRDGFIPVGRGSPRRHRVYGPDSLPRVADDVRSLMQQLYGADPDALHLEVNLGDTPTVENPVLMKAMRKLSRIRTHEARVELWKALINATLLLAVQDGQPRQLETIGNWPIFGVFTDNESVRHFDPRGTQTVQYYGHQVFPMLMDARTGILKINPDGLVGGELYRNELEVLARASRPHHR